MNETVDTRFTTYRSQGPLGHTTGRFNHGAPILGPAVDQAEPRIVVANTPA